MIVRRSGRTTALLRSALQLAHRNERVFFVVWDRAHISVIFDMLHREFSDWRYQMARVEVVSYETWVRTKPGTAVFDHYVTECLAEREGRDLGPDHITVYLCINGWYKQQAIPVRNAFDERRFRMAVTTPISDYAYGAELRADTGICGATVKTVDFRFAGEYKDGLMVLENV